MLEAVLFDFDGTLADTLCDLTACMNRLLTRYGLPLCTESDIQELVSLGEREYLRTALTEPVIRERGEDFFAEASAYYGEIYRAHGCDMTSPYPGITAALDELRRMGLRLGLVSNKAEAYLLPLAEQLFPGRFGAAAGTGVYPPKPDPALAIKAARMLRVNPARCAFVGDTPADMVTAVNAGMIPIGVSWGYRPEVLLRRAGAAAICAEPGDLPELIRLYKKGLIL